MTVIEATKSEDITSVDDVLNRFGNSFLLNLNNFFFVGNRNRYRSSLDKLCIGKSHNRRAAKIASGKMRQIQM